jgi:phosphoribosylformylglycinamidine (FGAM) synthase-like enzyme
MASGLGLDVDLDGLPPEVMLFSESNGRLLVTVPAYRESDFAARFKGLSCRRLGEVTADAKLVVRWQGETVVDLTAVDLATAFKETLSNG